MGTLSSESRCIKEGKASSYKERYCGIFSSTPEFERERGVGRRRRTPAAGRGEELERALVGGWWWKNRRDILNTAKRKKEAKSANRQEGKNKTAIQISISSQNINRGLEQQALVISFRY